MRWYLLGLLALNGCAEYHHMQANWRAMTPQQRAAFMRNVGNQMQESGDQVSNAWRTPIPTYTPAPLPAPIPAPDMGYTNHYQPQLGCVGQVPVSGQGINPCG